MQMNFGLKYDVVILYCSHVNLGEEPYPQIPPNGEWLSPKFEKSKLKILESKMNFPPK